MASFSPPPGTSDIFPDEISEWNQLEDTAKKVFPLYGYGEIRTPIFEYTEVFTRGIGNETEVVKKEMYSFEDRGGRELTLRPEGTAGVMRALMKTDTINGSEMRVFYIAPMFRGERPAAGRKRQFHQVGVENTGKIGPEYDAECIAMTMHYLNELGIDDSKLLINTRGTAADREPAANALKEYFGTHISSMCHDCQERLQKNIWRILDCKAKECQTIIKDSPQVSSLFGEKSREYFNKVVQCLKELGIAFEIDPRLVRGLDYYQHTVFEITHPSLGGQNAIAGGGRYEIFLPGSKKPLIGVGFAAGIERLLMVREALGIKSKDSTGKKIFAVSLGSYAKQENMKLANQLRHQGFTVVMELEDKSLKAQMRAVNRSGANYAIIRGDDEIEKNVIIVKNMATSEQKEIQLSELTNIL